MPDGDRYGAIDATGKMVLKGFEDEPSAFSSGRAAVRIDGMLCYIDRHGRVAIRGGYGEAGPLHHGLARVKAKDVHKYSYIDTTGRVVIAGPFKNATDFSSGFACAVPVGSKESEVLDPSGAVLYRTTENDLREIQNGLILFWNSEVRGMGYMDRYGRVLVPPGPNGSPYSKYSEGLVVTPVAAVSSKAIQAILDEESLMEKAAKKRAAEEAAEAAKRAPAQTGPPPGMVRYVWFRVSQAAETITQERRQMGATYTVYGRHYYVDYAYVDGPPGMTESQVAGIAEPRADSHQMAARVGQGVYQQGPDRAHVEDEAFKVLGVKKFDYDRIDASPIGTLKAEE